MRSFVKKDSRLLRREQALKSNLKKRKKFKEKYKNTKEKNNERTIR